jgi:hypothetical protein
MLRLAQIARQRADNPQTEAELDSLHGKIDPQFLLRVMVETKRRYDADPAGATRLVDDLVRFLRSAMPGVRSGASTVVAELQLADDYARVWAELEPARTTWVLHAGALPSEQPFPALLLLQALDQLAALAGGTPVAGVVDRVGSRTVLRLERSVTDATIGLADELLYRFRVGLRKFYGESWTLDVERTANRIALAITLPRPLSAILSQIGPALLPLSQPETTMLERPIACLDLSDAQRRHCFWPPSPPWRPSKARAPRTPPRCSHAPIGSRSRTS